MSRTFVEADCEVGSALRIGDSITLEIVRAFGHQARFSIHAPAEVRIVRSELLKNKAPDADASESGAD
jgi:sRNA-binding carbon storage regulator CsrA